MLLRWQHRLAAYARSVRERLRVLKAVFLTTTVLVVGVACATRTPHLPASALGCYEVIVEGWSDAVREVTTIDSLPWMIALDSALERRDLTRAAKAPIDWRVQGARMFSVSWRTTWGDWMQLADTAIIPVPYGPMYHELGGDSIIVQFTGGITAFLEPMGVNYRGLAQISPLEFARSRGIRLLPFELRRMACPSSEDVRLVGAL